MADLTDRQIINLAKSCGIVTGENLRRGSDYLFRSMGTPTNVFGGDLILFARAVLTAATATTTDCACGDVTRQGWTHRPGWCNEGDDHYPAAKAPGVKATAPAGFTWPPKACPCLDYQQPECQEKGCEWERDPSKVPLKLRRRPPGVPVTSTEPKGGA
jgi:hypothetical protein